MKIAFVAHWDWTLYNFRMPLANVLREHGCDLVFICPHGTYVPRMQEAGLRVVDWPLRRRSFNPLFEVLAVAHLARIYRREAPDAVHHFTIKPNLYGSMAAYLAGVPKVIDNFTGLGFVFADTPASRALRAFILPLLRFALRPRRTMTVFQNAHDRASLVQRGVVREAQTRVIAGSGVDTERFAPSADGHVRNPEPIVLMAARLLMDKGLEEFVSAAQQLRSMGIRGRFWVAGTPDRGNPACVPEVLLTQWQRDGCVEFLGHCDDMPALLRQADIAVLPSYHEGLSRFLLEAAATGLPLVGTDIEGCRLIIQEGRNGLLVPPKDDLALAKALSKLLTDSALRLRLGRESRALAVEEFHEQRILDEYLRLYREMAILPAPSQDLEGGIVLDLTGPGQERASNRRRMRG